MPFKFREVRKSLKKKGFVEDKKGHHVYLRHLHNGKRTGAYTLVSHSKPSADVGDDIVKSMKRQLKLRTNQDVHELVECPMTSENYVDVLEQSGIIPTGNQ